MSPDYKAIAEEMVQFASSIVRVKVSVLTDESDQPTFNAAIYHQDAEGTAMSLLPGWAQIIRKSLPDRQNEWSSAILVEDAWGPNLGFYWVGRIGHEDVWAPFERHDPLYLEKWEEFYRRLDEYLQVRGKRDWRGEGDYYVFDETSGYLEQSITIYRIEFLTPEIVSAIQDMLRHGYPDWSVYIVLDLIPPVEGIGSDGIRIYTDQIVEKWDRALLAKRLGERLKV